MHMYGKQRNLQNHCYSASAILIQGKDEVSRTFTPALTLYNITIYYSTVRFVTLIYIFPSITFLPNEAQKAFTYTSCATRLINKTGGKKPRTYRKKRAKQQHHNTNAKNGVFYPLKGHSSSVTCKLQVTQILQSRARQTPEEHQIGS